MDRITRSIEAGGITVHNIKTSTLAENEKSNRFISDSLNVVQNISTAELSLKEIISFSLQLVLENSFSKNMQQMQIVYNENQECTESLKNVMLQNVPEVAYFYVNKISHLDISKTSNLTVITEDLDCLKLGELVQQLTKGKFVFAMVKNNLATSYTNTAVKNGMNVVFGRNCSGYCCILFRKKQNLSVAQIIKDSKDVVSDICKVNLQKLEKNKRLVVIVQKEVRNLIAFMENLERSIPLAKIRVYYIQGINLTHDALLTEIYENQLELDLLVNILTPGKVWATMRRSAVSTSPKSAKNWTAVPEYANGQVNLMWTEKPAVKDTKNIVKVEYSTISPQDVLAIKGRFDLSSSNYNKAVTQPSIGLEFSGTDSAGNRVMGISSNNCLSRYVQPDPLWTWKVPKSWSLEDATTIPASYLLAYSALIIKGEAKQGDKVMIDNPCDSIGLAIIQLAMKKKCDLFIICQNEMEKKFLLQNFSGISEKRLFIPEGNNFGDSVLMATEGKGVDVLICNQTSIKALDNIITVGRYQTHIVVINDLDDNDVHEYIGMNLFLREMSIFFVVPKRILHTNEYTKKRLAALLQEGIKNEIVQPLARAVYKMDSLTKAFEICRTKKSLGKVVIKVQPDQSNSDLSLAVQKLQCSYDHTYLVIEGLTLCGLELIDLLVSRGARNIITTSSSTVDTGLFNLKSTRWQSLGVQLSVIPSESVLNETEIKSILNKASSIGPVDGIFDLQRLNNSSKANLIEPMNSVVITLDKESRVSCPELRYYMVFSAIQNAGSTLLTNKFADVNKNLKSQEQTIENTMNLRRKDSLPGTLVRFGLLVDSKGRGSNQRVVLPPITKYLQMLDQVLAANKSVAEIAYCVSTTKEVEDDKENKYTQSPEELEIRTFNDNLYNYTSKYTNPFVYLNI